MEAPSYIALDMEFTQLSFNTELISLGMVTNKKAFYFENKDWNFSTLRNNPKQKDWITKNIVPNLWFADSCEKVYRHQFFHNMEAYVIHDTLESMLPHLKAWLSQFEHIIIVGDVCNYDWVIFCELFGGATKIPKNIFYIPIDIATLLYDRGGKHFADETRLDIYNEYVQEAYRFLDIAPHNALHDAYIIKYIYDNVLQKKVVQYAPQTTHKVLL